MSEWQQPEQGGNPYAGYQPYGAGAPLPRTDGISIAAFVSALTCCAGPVGVGLGIAGIVRTKGGRRRGRWAAVTGVVVGSIATLAMIGVFVAFVVAISNTVFEEDAEVGQCVNTGFLGTESDDLWDASCSEDHDAEVVAVNVATGEMEAAYDAGDSVADICRPLVGEEYLPLFDDPTYRVDFATDAFSEEIDEDSWVVCFIERSDGEQLDAPLTGESSGA